MSSPTTSLVYASRQSGAALEGLKLEGVMGKKKANNTLPRVYNQAFLMFSCFGVE